MNVAFRSPVLAYQRHHEALENALVAAGLAVLVGLFLEGMGLFAGQWRTVLLLAIFALGTRSRAWGYYAAVATLAWPIWLLSPYLMTLFLVVTLLPRNVMIDSLPWAMMVAAMPVLAQWQVVGLVPLLAGLLAGPTTGLVAGLCGALWLKMIAGLLGWPAELGWLHGAPFSLADLQPRVAGISSLETLMLLTAPFSESSAQLLLHALQVVAWGIAGWLVGKVRFMEWRNGEPRFIMAPALASGAIVLWAALFLLPPWLELESLSRILTSPLPTVGLALSSLTAALVTTVYEGLHQPVVIRRPERRRVTRRLGREGMQTVVEETTVPRRHPWPDRPRPDEDDVIMLELD